MYRGHVLALMLSLATVPACAETVLACADQAEMPPFVYAERINGNKTANVTGVSVDLLRLIGAPLGWALLHKLSLTGTFPSSHEFTRYGRTEGVPARSCD